MLPDPSDAGLYTIRQNFKRPRCDDVEQAVRQEVAKTGLQLRPGARIALAVGSRGIANIGSIVKSAVAAVREAGGDPFIVPAMGSHAGATAEGQEKLLAEYGITGKNMNAPVVSSMEVVELGRSRLGNRVFMDKAAHGADGIILMNRIKPHTDFHGIFESGLVKMAVIGLGKHEGAMELHSFGVNGLRSHVPMTFEKIAGTGKVLAGIAIVENAYDETAFIEAIPAANIMRREPELLGIARDNMPRLPIDDIDVLLVDRMGKDISGVGLDPNVIGRIRISGQEEPLSPRIKNIAVTGLTPASCGNALGVGLADVITRKLFEAIRYETMAVNVRTSRFLERIKVPFIAESDADAFGMALKSCAGPVPGRERIVRIQDTLHCAEVQVSKAVYEEIKNKVELVKGPEKIFNAQGGLIPMQ
jgi:hypothetical protein